MPRFRTKRVYQTFYDENGRGYSVVLSFERSGIGVTPEHYETSVGADSARDYDTGEPIDIDDLPESVMRQIEAYTPADAGL